MAFADLLLELLKEYHMSQRTLARKSGVNYVTINRLINGYSSRITRETVEKLADGLGCSREQRDALLGAAGRAPGEVETKFAESPERARLFRQISGLDVEEASDLLRELEDRARAKNKKPTT
jgi:transcriptional regulator with XRE-family HTH domain